ncbi:hypothetical protein ACFYRL_17505 [Streptomyces goshikiensis]|uniref:hypothetical protein n=1 Tax=Streptomyces goshikiensis TaxID=1942 RepID=UPI0036A4BFBE
MSSPTAAPTRPKMTSAQVWDSFQARVEELGGVVLEPAYLGNGKAHRVRCGAGHDCAPRPAGLQQGQGLCITCAGKDPHAAEAAFRARLAELGATLLEPEWRGVNKAHRVRCAAGHECGPFPGGVRKGGGICRTCARNDPRVAEAAFRARLDELGAALLEPIYLGANKAHRIRCAAGHESAPRPASLTKGQGICITCAGTDPRVAEAAFRARLAELGATLLEPEWRGVNRAHRVRCAAGHDCTPRPNGVGRGQGICRTCARNDTKAAEAAFRTRLAELGATLLEPLYLGANESHRARCAAGHDCTPRPAHVRQGGGICRTCARNDTKAAEAAFRTRLAELGATLLEPEWLGNAAPHRVRCIAGHDCNPRPASVQQGQGICRTCAGQDPRVAEAAFRARLAELGATLLEPEWLGSSRPHQARCAAGHACAPIPTAAQRNHGICRTCAGNDPRVAEAEFRARLAELGATLLEPVYRGVNRAHRVRCAAGHDCTTRPYGLREGVGVCLTCGGHTWDVLYVVADEVGDVVKFGITAGNARRRLGVHARDGLEEVVRLVTGLPDGVAVEIERNLIGAMRDAREAPVRGREYFAARVLPLVLDLIDNHPAVRAATAGAEVG